ncbi:MAG: PAS domain-containing protein [Alphaproteobacteria bacterium]|nr:PAS domain-containing protein [Alphaproteobacteria bacterium]
MLKTPSISSYTAQWLLLGGALFLLCLNGGYNILLDHHHVTDSERQRLQTQAQVIHKNLEQEIRATNAALQELVNDLPRWRGKDGWGDGATVRLRALANAMPGIRTFSIVDKNGIVSAANRPEILGANVSSRDYFKDAQRAPSPDMLYLSPPFTSLLNVFIIGATRMIPGPNGGFDGVVNASLDPDYFATLLSSVNYAPDMWSALAHSSGIHFMLRPDREGTAGMNVLKPNSFFTRHMESGKDVSIFSGTVYGTGENRIMAMINIRPENLQTNHFFVASVSRDIDSVYAVWTRSAITQAAILAVIALASILALAHYQKRARHFEAARKDSEAALQKSLADFNDLVNQIPVGIYKLRMQSNGSQRFEYVSPRWCSDLGVSRETAMESVEATFSKFHPEDMEKFFKFNTEARLKLKPFEWEGRLINENGETRWLHIESRPNLQANGDIIWSGIQYDITERVALLDNLKRSNADLEQFAYVASHDLREPLRMISGFVSLLAKRNIDKFDEDSKEFIAFAVDGAKRMDGMIQDLLEYSRIGRGDRAFTLVDLKEAVDEAVLNLKPTIEGSNGTIEFTSPLPAVRGDYGMLMSLFQNLIGNALKYRDPDRKPVIRISAAKAFGQWVITVADNGIGMAPENLDRIFGVFQRLHSRQQYGGSGIGLAICKKVAERHQGRIWVESTLGEGSAFHVSLPDKHLS